MMDPNSHGKELTTSESADFWQWEGDLGAADSTKPATISAAVEKCAYFVRKIKEQVTQPGAVKRSAEAVYSGLIAVSATVSPEAYVAYKAAKDNQ